MRILLFGLATVICLPALMGAASITLDTINPNPNGALGQAYGAGSWHVDNPGDFSAVGFRAQLLQNPPRDPPVVYPAQAQCQGVGTTDGTWSSTETGLPHPNWYRFWGRLFYYDAPGHLTYVDSGTSDRFVN